MDDVNIMSDEASMQKPPHLDPTDRLLDCVAAEGMQTASDPIDVAWRHVHQSENQNIPAFSIGFLKSQNR
eukprot:9738559-Karenia_brevis.AAC.1